VIVDASVPLVVARRRGAFEARLRDLRVLDAVDGTAFIWDGPRPRGRTGTVWIGPSWQAADQLDAEWHVTVGERVVYLDRMTSADLAGLLVAVHSWAEQVRVQVRRGDGLAEYDARPIER
jgi:hypothetical protein